LFRLTKQKVLLPCRENFGLFFKLVGHLRTTLSLVLYRKFEQEVEPVVLSPENVEVIRVATQRRPGKSTGKAAREMGISRRSIQRIFHSDLKLFPYKMSVLHKLPITTREEGFNLQRGHRRKTQH
jgi:hypothetical protein